MGENGTRVHQFHPSSQNRKKVDWKEENTCTILIIGAIGTHKSKAKPVATLLVGINQDILERMRVSEEVKTANLDKNVTCVHFVSAVFTPGSR